MNCLFPKALHRLRNYFYTHGIRETFASVDAKPVEYPFPYCLLLRASIPSDIPSYKFYARQITTSVGAEPMGCPSPYAMYCPSGYSYGL